VLQNVAWYHFGYLYDVMACVVAAVSLFGDIEDIWWKRVLIDNPIW